MNDFNRGDVEGLLDQVQSQLQMIGQLQQKRANLIGRGSVRSGRVSVAVNADGVVIDVKFGRNVEDLEYSELARAVTDASRRAVEDVTQQAKQLMAPLEKDRARLPKLSDLLPGMPDLSSAMPSQERAPMTKPDDPSRVLNDESDSPPMKFDNVEVVDGNAAGKRGVTDSGW